MGTKKARSLELPRNAKYDARHVEPGVADVFEQEAGSVTGCFAGAFQLERIERQEP
jgi:hypothetical protein